MSLTQFIPDQLKPFLRELRSKLEMIGRDNSPIKRSLTKYFIHGASVAEWSQDHQQPKGALESTHYYPHLLLAKAILQSCSVNSWCDLGSGVASLPLSVARHGIDNILAIDGTTAALVSPLVRFPLSNYLVADLTECIQVLSEEGKPVEFDVVSALELLEHIPEEKLQGLYKNIQRMNPSLIIIAMGLQPDPPHHVNLKSMQEWIDSIGKALPGWIYDDHISEQIFHMAKHSRFINDYHTNHLPHDRNLLIFARRA